MKKVFRLNFWAIALLVTGFFSSCEKDPINNTPTVEQKQYDQSYGSDTRHRLDVYLPANRTAQTPFVILIHGGGWAAGDKADMRGLQDSLLKHNIGSVSLNYRYASATVHYADLMQDVANAVSYVKAKSNEWKIRPNQYVIGGMSAGAHMSLLYGYKYDNNNDIKAIISACGPTDLSNVDYLNYALLLGQIAIMNNIAGANYVFGQPVPNAFREASPRFFIKNKATLMIHGDADNIVPYQQAVTLKADLDAAGFTNRLVTIPGANHDLGMANPATNQLILTEIYQWIQNHS